MLPNFQYTINTQIKREKENAGYKIHIVSMRSTL